MLVPRRATNVSLWVVASLALVCGLGTWPASAHAQAAVRVIAETRIDLAAERAGTTVQVLGVLRDDLGQALPHSALHVSTRPVDSADALSAPPGVFGSQSLVTDTRGEFTLTVAWVGTPFVLSCSFAGDEFHLPTTVERPVDPTLADVRLRYDLDVTGREVDLDLPELRVRVFAESSQGGDGMTLTLRDELGREYGSAETDMTGHALFTLRSLSDAHPGPGRWLVDFGGDARRSAARAELAVVRTRGTSLQAALVDDDVDPGDEARVDGRLSDARGPVAAGAISLYADDVLLVTVATGADGRFAASFDVPAEREGSTWTLEARFAPESPGLRASTSEPLALRVGSPLPLDWLWLLVPLALSGVALAVTRKRERQGERSSVSTLPSAPGVSVGTRTSATHRHDTLGGVVVDHASNAARGDAQVTAERLDGPAGVPVAVHRAVSDADGRFVIKGLTAGEYRLRVSLAGYVEVDQRVHVPHRGEWSDVVVRVESYRTRALAVFRRVGRRFVSSERAFETTTNRELPASAPEAQRASLRALAEQTDHLYYGPRDPRPEDLPPLERAATALLRTLPAPDAPPRDE